MLCGRVLGEFSLVYDYETTQTRSKTSQVSITRMGQQSHPKNVIREASLHAQAALTKQTVEARYDLSSS